MGTEKKLLVVDGMALLFRSFYAMGRAGLTAPDGTPIGAVFGFLKVLLKILKEQQPTHLAVAWEAGGPNFRHEMHEDYKAHRKAAPDEIRVQIPMIQNILTDIGIASLFVKGFEGDDIVGTLTSTFSEDGRVIILSSDKDFMQLVNDRIQMLSLKKGDDYELIGPENVEDYFGVSPDKVIDVLALMGDTSDNVPGVAGIGPKKAAQLISSYGTLTSLYEHIDELPENKQKQALIEGKDQAFLSRELVTLKLDVPLDINESKLSFDFETFAANTTLHERLSAFHMSSLLKSLPSTKTSPQKSKKAQEPSLENNTELLEEAREQSLESEIIEDKSAETPTQDYKSWGSRNYHIVSTKKMLEDICTRISSPTTESFAFDTETTGLDFIEDIPIGISLAFSPDEAFYIPACEEHLSSGGIFSHEPHFEFTKSDVWEALKTAFAKRTAILIGHNLKFDLHMMRNVGVSLGSGPIACTLIASWLLNPVQNTYGIDNQCLKLLSLQKIPTTRLIGKETGRKSMTEVPLSQLSEYACEDADGAIRLAQILIPEMKADEKIHWLFWNIEMPFLRILAETERIGVHVDKEYLGHLSAEIRGRLKILETDIFSLSGQEFNIGSPKQLGKVLFEDVRVQDVLKYKGKLTKTTLGYKTDAAVLEQFSKHPLVNAVLEYRELSKLLNTYIDVLPSLIKPSTGRIHTEFRQAGTATGRLSSSEPNLQNIPVRTPFGKRVRAAFNASTPENEITSADYSQIELRVLAHLAQDESMLRAFREKHDIHRETAAKIQGKDPQEISADDRAAAKAINFGIIYGMGPQRLAKEQNITLAQAKNFIEKYFLNFGAVRRYLDSQRIQAYENGLVRTYYGRPRPIPELHSKNPGIARLAENIAVNSPIQGTAADLMKIAMLRVHEVFQQRQLSTRMILQVHDELVFEGPKTEREQLTNILREAMEGVADFSVPLIVEIGHGNNWLDAK